MASFTSAFKSGGSRTKFNVRNVGNLINNANFPANKMSEWFEFEYEIDHRYYTEETRCTGGQHLTTEIPSAQLYCTGRDCLLNSPAAPNTGKRMLSDNEFTKRFLQKLAGPDVSNVVYEDEFGPLFEPSSEYPFSLPLEIPTRTFQTDQYWLPGPVIDRLLAGKMGLTRPNRRLLSESVIEGEMSNGKATLSTELENATNNHYEFKVKDKLRQDISPPAAIKIEELPQHGKLSVTEHDGTVRELKVGDVVSGQLMSSFKYEQGEEGCSLSNEASCKDTILYSTLSSWVGTGQEASAQIRLTPVVAASPSPAQIETPSASKSQAAAAPELQELKEEEKEELAPVVDMAEEAGCSTMPPVVINILIGVASMLGLVTVSLLGYYMYAQKQRESKKTAEEANKDFDAIAENNVAAQSAE